MAKAPRDRFLNSGVVAIVGASDNRRKFGHTVFKTLTDKNYSVVPVNPNTPTVMGHPCYSTLRSIGKPVGAAIVVVKPESAESVVDDAIKSGVKRLWFQQGADFSAAATKAEKAGLEVVTGRCILMYAEPVEGIHAFHRFLSKLFKKLQADKDGSTVRQEPDRTGCKSKKDKQNPS